MYAFRVAACDVRNPCLHLVFIGLHTKLERSPANSLKNMEDL